MERWNKLKKWQKIAIGVFVLFIIVGVFTPAEQETEANTANTVVEDRREILRKAQEKKAQEKAVEQPESKPEVKESLAEKVDKQYKSSWGITSYTDFLMSEDYPAGSLVGYINKMEGVSSGTIRVYVQADVTEEEAKGLAKNVLGMVGMDIEELDWVIVRGVEGRDYQASRNDMPALR